jgi:predicted ATP-grasp superfamily ATP-dependent carboligase
MAIRSERRYSLPTAAIAPGPSDHSRRSPAMKALVTDGDERPALAVTRSLGRRGISVIVGEERRGSLASASRYCSGQVTYPSAYRDPEQFASFVRDFVRREQIDVIVPVTDVTTHAVAKHRDAISAHAACAVPPLDAFELMTDKHRLLQQAARCGVAIPRTHFVNGAAALDRVLADVVYPAVVKPARSRIPTKDGWLAASVVYARDRDALVRLYAETPYLSHYPSLIQERIAGRGTGVFVLCDHGRIVAAFAHRRLREKPPSGGASVLCESIAVDPSLRAQAARLLAPIGWHGVAMLEYKQDRAGRSFLMEVNGRFWGSLQLAIDAGVDFPSLAWQLALGQRVDVPSRYEIGVRNRWLLGDLDHLLRRLRDTDSVLTQGMPSRLRAVVDFLTPQRRDEIFRVDDPRPAGRELWSYTRALAASVASRLRPRAASVRAPRPTVPVIASRSIPEHADAAE